MSNNWTFSSKLCFFKKLPQCFHWRDSAMNTGIRITGSAVKKHISSEMARELIAIYQTTYHLWFLEYQRVLPQLRVRLSRHHHRSQHRPTVIQYRKTELIEAPVPERNRGMNESYGETRCMILQKPKNEIKISNPKKYKEIYRMNCLTGYRNSVRIWLIKVLPKSVGET